MFFTFRTKSEGGEYLADVLAVHETGTVKGPNRVVLLPKRARVPNRNFVFEYSEFRRGTVPSSSFNFTLSQRKARQSKTYSTYLRRCIYYTTIRLNTIPNMVELDYCYFFSSFFLTIIMGIH